MTSITKSQITSKPIAVAPPTTPIVGAVFKETLRRERWNILIWGVGLALMAIMVMSVLQEADLIEEYGQIAEMLPPALIQAFLGEDISFIGTPEGYLAMEFFTMAMLVYVFYGVLAGLAIFAHDEALGSLDMVLSLPVPRWQLIAEKVAAYAVVLVIMLGMNFIGFVVGRLSNAAIEVNLWALLAGLVMILPLAFCVMALTLLFTCWVPRRAKAAQWTIIIVIASYMLNFIGQMVSDLPWLEFVRQLSPFSYYLPANTIRNGIVWGDAALLLTASALMIGLAIWRFQRRDVGTLSY